VPQLVYKRYDRISTGTRLQFFCPATGTCCFSSKIPVSIYSDIKYRCLFAMFLFQDGLSSGIYSLRNSLSSKNWWVLRTPMPSRRKLSGTTGQRGHAPGNREWTIESPFYTEVSGSQIFSMFSTEIDNSVTEYLTDWNSMLGWSWEILRTCNQITSSQILEMFPTNQWLRW